ncbi:SOS response-associated peptidase [Nitrospina watsonii]|uniref:Abasic site processing protein n=1 Tax=Nitrospina watsonii TaxID=1323948 RepID=A0ABN8VXG1_9BACT|nr:SOS response-associated peptidase [Nitrospina watsonii]CAI2717876.1 Abasic site processing protein YoqW [Nitrospina watsonii]
MCGRYSLTKPLKTIQHHFAALPVGLFHEPRYNIAPSQTLPVVVNNGSERTLRPMRWGLLPAWAKDEKLGHKLINARAETVHEKPSFKASFRQHRCLVPTDGFYEWKQDDNGKTPHRIFMEDGALFAFAGLWSAWRGPAGPIETFTILTTEANRPLQSLHHRMPVILMPEDYSGWLDPAATSPSLKALMQPLAGDKLTFHAISKTVNSPKNDLPDCQQPLHD